ncbi:MAG: transcriptional regulator [Parcubacteria group bacterium GW2011_GWA2_47_12]|nr:MAG: transcriptional regulator [Parcubacteria group bacterium GW2011_GWA2_47_12]
MYDNIIHHFLSNAFCGILVYMSGHNKWSQIKEKKGKTDAKKSQVFSKFAKLIANEARAARSSGGQVNKDAPALRAAIERARKENMPSDNIERAIKKATEAGAKALEKVMYEAYGPGGAAILIETLTDNTNKTAQEIKHLLSENGGNLASPGAAAWAFEKTAGVWKPTTTVPLSEEDLNKLSALVEKLEAHEDVQEVITNAE